MKTKISIVDSDTIRNHQLNTSQSKNGYLFKKSKRFNQPNPECKMAFYCNGSELSHRKTSFGYGSKLDFTKSFSCSPASTKYISKSSFDLKGKKGNTFGLSRDLLPDRSYLTPQLHSIPGPGQYSTQKTKRSSLGYTMRSKIVDITQSKQSNRSTPGPGHYQDINLQPQTGKFTCSKYKDILIPKLDMDSQRFVNGVFGPGPQTYIYDDNMSNRGRYLQSKNKGSGVRGFSQGVRDSFTDQVMKKFGKYPGPGEYQRTSDFGIYGDWKYYNTLGGTVK